MTASTPSDTTSPSSADRLQAAARAPLNAGEGLLAPALDNGLADRPAIVFQGQTTTYAELAAEANRAGNAWRHLGLEVGDRLLMVVHDRPYFFAAYLGALKVGAIPIAFSLRASADDLAFAICDSGCRALLIDCEFLPLFEKIAGTLDRPPIVVIGDGKTSDFPMLAELMAAQPDTLVPAVLPPDAPAFWMYTSGTTGTPKAAIHRQECALAGDRFLGQVLGLEPGDRLFCTSKMFFAFALGHVFLGALRLGLTTILFDGWPTVEAVAEMVEKERPTVLLSVPTMYRNLLRDGLALQPAFRRVRYCLSAGERLPEGVFEQWREATGSPIIEGIGATEAAYMFLANRPGDCEAGSCGVPNPGYEVRLTDEAGQKITAAETPGVLWVRSDCIADGYWQQPDKTAAAFRDGWYRTGDVFVRAADGRFRHLGRADETLKISGQWVSPAEIEACAAGCQGVAEAAVAGAQDGDGLTRLVLFLVAPDDAAPEVVEATVRDTLPRHLSPYKCPRRIRVLDDMPRTPTGKVQRSQLGELAQSVMAGG